MTPYDLSRVEADFKVSIDWFIAHGHKWNPHYGPRWNWARHQWETWVHSCGCAVTAVLVHRQPSDPVLASTGAMINVAAKVLDVDPVWLKEVYFAIATTEDNWPEALDEPSRALVMELQRYGAAKNKEGRL